MHDGVETGKNTGRRKISRRKISRDTGVRSGILPVNAHAEVNILNLN